MAHSLAVAPSTSSRVLGLLGILGGALLLAAFVIDIAPDLNALRLIAFNAGALAIVAAVHRRQASAAPTLALVGVAPAFLANALYLGLIVASIGRPEAFAGASGWIWLGAGIAMWLADAWFGIVTLRLGVVARWGALALAIGSVLAIAGIDRLGRTSEANPTVFGTIALAGAALNGIGWILLGIDVATRRRAPAAEPRPES